MTTNLFVDELAASKNPISPSYSHQSAYARRSRLITSAFVLVCQMTVISAVLVWWGMAVEQKIIDPFFYGRPSAIWDQLWRWFAGGSIWHHLYVTLKEMLFGYFSGAGLAIILGFILGYGRLIARIIEPFIGMLNGVPKVVLAPLLILWFGIDVASKVALAASIVFFIVFYAVYTGVREVDVDLLDRARVLGASRFQIFTSVLLPSTMTWIFSSLRVSIGLALGGAVVGEYLASNEGIGFLIATASASFQATGVMAGIAVIMLVTIVMNYALELVERRFAVWKA
jgi:NitT/TauT family transport system permease protein